LTNFPDERVTEGFFLNIFSPVLLTGDYSHRSTAIAVDQLSVEIDQLADHVWPRNEQYQ
jgi:hypothetical protein